MKTYTHTLGTTLLFLLLPIVCAAQTITLGSTTNFVVFTSVGAITNVGASYITGDIGSNSGAISGFGNVDGSLQSANAITGIAATDLGIAYSPSINGFLFFNILGLKSCVKVRFQLRYLCLFSTGNYSLMPPSQIIVDEKKNPREEHQ